MADLAEAEAAGRAAVGDDLARMRALGATDVLAFNAAIDPPERGVWDVRRLRSIVDGWVIPQPEADAYRTGAFMAVPAIVGNTVAEGGTLTAEVSTYSVPPAHDTLAKHVTTPDQLRAFIAANFGAVADEAWNFYGATTNAAVWTALADIWADGRFLYGVRGLAREISKREPRTYRYVFTHAGAHTSNPPVHGNDTTYVFGTGDFDAKDRAVSDAIVAAFANFAATGDPNGPGAPHWSPYDAQRDNELEFGGGFVERTGRRAEALAFIERIR
jgi:carboxylesterase type B